MSPKSKKARRIKHDTIAPAPQVGSIYTPLGQRKYLDADERQRFLHAVELLEPDEKLFCLTLLWTGCRISEVLSMTVTNLSVCENIVVIRTLKKRNVIFMRRVPISDTLMNTLAGYALSIEGRLWPWTRKQGWRVIKIVMAMAGICLLYTSPSPRDQRGSRMPSSA